jgi:hypothetical protein
MLQQILIIFNFFFNVDYLGLLLYSYYLLKFIDDYGLFMVQYYKNFNPKLVSDFILNLHYLNDRTFLEQIVFQDDYLKLIFFLAFKKSINLVHMMIMIGQVF